MLGQTVPTSQLPAFYMRDVTTFNVSRFDVWLALFRWFQKEVMASCEGQERGQICLPTGTGKTWVQVALHLLTLIAKQKSGECGVSLIASHRLGLNKQLLEDLVMEAAQIGLEFDILFVGSAREDENYYNDELDKQGFSTDIKSQYTCSEEEIKIHIEQAKRNKKHLLIVSTYNSINKLEGLCTIDMFTADEAHTIVKGVTDSGRVSFRDNIEKISGQILRRFFFTATRKVSGDDKGMNDFAFYGPLLYSRSPREMIDAMEIVGPRLQIVAVKNEKVGESYTNDTMMAKAAIEAFDFHCEDVKKASARPELINGKLMIACPRDSAKLMALYTNERFVKYCTDKKIRTFAFSSVDGGNYYIDFKKVKREEAMKAMLSLRDDEPAILVHIDILSEGIDLPSITGVMVYRELEGAKLVQNLGRGARLFKLDRELFYKGQIAIGEYDKLVKPKFSVIVPVFYDTVGEYQDIDSFKKKVKEIYNEYEMKSYEVQFVELGDKGIIDEPDPLPKDKKTIRQKEADLINYVLDLEQEKVEDDIMGCEDLEALFEMTESLISKEK